MVSEFQRGGPLDQWNIVESRKRTGASFCSSMLVKARDRCHTLLLKHCLSWLEHHGSICGGKVKSTFLSWKDFQWLIERGVHVLHTQHLPTGLWTIHTEPHKCTDTHYLGHTQSHAHKHTYIYVNINSNIRARIFSLVELQPMMQHCTMPWLLAKYNRACLITNGFH